MLSKLQLADAIAEKGAGGRQQVKNMLDALAEVVAEQISAGENVSVPGVANLKFRYTAPLKKGERHKKGDTYTGFGGVEQVAEEDSKPRKEAIKLKADLAPALKRLNKDAKVLGKAKRKAKS